MKNKKNRLEVIKEIFNTSIIRSQDDLLQALSAKGFSLTQATLSRDLKLLKVAKQANENGEYLYILPSETQDSNLLETKSNNPKLVDKGFLSINFSGNMAVIKTRPGYAGSIASDIDENAFPQFLGSIAGDDTVLLILKEKITRELALKALSTVILQIHT